ncbi:ACT domain-containing protein ACR4-like isoform X2 [Oryza brachyantha]|uniref:ACT domain-containing protein ACR n=1 Tax=Oryza brachyantha TaxID=4533 RepID=J3LQL9_ORYBR|nr:ACT domain-containing protein ACR4-like isoform X2 [Oryza brachyantha]
MSMDEGYGPTWDSDDEYDNFIRKMNPPRIEIDNDSCSDATIVRVDSANEYGILLEVIQVLIDLNLVISKAYITSDGGWFMDVFNITDKEGQKLKDKATIARIEDYICKSLGADSRYIPSRRRSVDVAASSDHNVIELTGTDRPGLLSEVSAVLASLKCNVVSAEIWTHNTRAAAVMRVTDEDTGLAVTDTGRLERIRDKLSYLLRGGNVSRGAAMAVSTGASTTHTDRRLHQMMLDDGDHEQLHRHPPNQSQRPNVTVSNWNDKDYSVVTIRCKDRPKLLFDTVCTLTDLHYVVFHANIDAKDNQAYQEFYVRHVNGSPMNTEADRLRVIQCLEAAIERRASEGVKLELCTNDKVGLLSEVTRIFRENSLTVTRAEVSTRGRMAVNTFYVRDSAGGTVDQKTIDSIRQAIGQNIQVKNQPEPSDQQKKESPTWFLFANLFRPRSLYSFGMFMR